MKVLADLHMHTVFSDGKDTPEEMVRSALLLGLNRVGISDHSYTSFDESYCISKDKISEYKEEINRLKEKYAGQIEVLCGIEQDYYSEINPEGYDYVIGSVHYLCVGKPDGLFVPVDESPEILIETAKKYFHGDIYALCAEYFNTVSDVIARTDADIIGHFDLISKFNEDNSLFDPHDLRYIKAWKDAADRLLEKKKPFEINTGAISRGYRSFPYPSAEMISYIREKGGKLILSSDAHSKDTIAWKFSEFKDLI